MDGCGASRVCFFFTYIERFLAPRSVRFRHQPAEDRLHRWVEEERKLESGTEAVRTTRSYDNLLAITSSSRENALPPFPQFKIVLKNIYRRAWARGGPCCSRHRPSG